MAAALQPVPVPGFPIGYKSMNTHIHVLEALTALARVWRDPLVRTRLEETLVIVRDKIAVEPGCLNLCRSQRSAYPSINRVWLAFSAGVAMGDRKAAVVV